MLPWSVHGNFSLRKCPAGRRCPRRGRHGTAVGRAASPTVHAGLQTRKDNSSSECAVGIRDIQRGTLVCMHGGKDEDLQKMNTLACLLFDQMRKMTPPGYILSPRSRTTMSDWTLRNNNNKQKRFFWKVRRNHGSVKLTLYTVCHDTCWLKKGKGGKIVRDWAKENNSSSGTMTECMDILKTSGQMYGHT